MQARRPKVSRYRRFGHTFVALGLALALAVMPAIAVEDDLEYKVKAAFLFNFARFVIWPPAKFSAPASPIELCVLGKDPFGATLDDTVRGKTIANRPLVVLRSARSEELRACHIVYLSGTSREYTAAALAALAGHAVLTVYEADTPLPGGVVRFFIEDRRVRFEINMAQAQREELELSSKLLGVARVIQQ